MPLTIRTASVALALALATVAASSQTMLLDVLSRHGVQLPGGSFERAFDEGMAPSTPVTPGSFATPLALLTSGTGQERVDAAFAFGILAGRSGRAASAPELNAAGSVLVQMIGSGDRRARIAGARVAGRIFAVPFDARVATPLPAGLVDALFALWNRDQEIEQLAAMDALGLLRQLPAVSALTERYQFYRDTNKRALAGGAIEALARIGDRSTLDLVKVLATDKWSEGRDATALAVAFARERMLKDGSVAIIRQALDDRARRAQALGYLAELGVSAP
ncbi:MAG TPA: hypothetical protein VFV51_03555 [Vicinamibacterales bacterium]|nr:hypothetical protein [Vicinamibacterales bacterium]